MLPAKAGDLRFLVPRWPVEGRDITTQLRDVSAAMRLRMLGQEPEFGFDRQQVRDRGKPNDVFDLRDRV